MCKVFGINYYINLERRKGRSFFFFKYLNLDVRIKFGLNEIFVYNFWNKILV